MVSPSSCRWIVTPMRAFRSSVRRFPSTLARPGPKTMTWGCGCPSSAAGPAPSLSRTGRAWASGCSASARAMVAPAPVPGSSKVTVWGPFGGAPRVTVLAGVVAVADVVADGLGGWRSPPSPGTEEEEILVPACS